MKIYLSIPVSSAEAERSFSTLKRIKTKEFGQLKSTGLKMKNHIFTKMVNHAIITTGMVMKGVINDDLKIHLIRDLLGEIVFSFGRKLRLTKDRDYDEEVGIINQ